jgi:hypothetical protein
MRLTFLMIIMALFAGCVSGEGLKRFADGVNHGIKHVDEGRQSAAGPPIHHTPVQQAPAGMQTTDYKCMTDCKRSNYKQSTCDNMCRN